MTILSIPMGLWRRFTHKFSSVQNYVTTSILFCTLLIQWDIRMIEEDLDGSQGVRGRGC